MNGFGVVVVVFIGFVILSMVFRLGRSINSTRRMSDRGIWGPDGPDAGGDGHGGIDHGHQHNAGHHNAGGHHAGGGHDFGGGHHMGGGHDFGGGHNFGGGGGGDVGGGHHG
jgi:hypothetical protein